MSNTIEGDIDIDCLGVLTLTIHIGPDIRLSESGKKIGVIGLKCLG